MFIKINGMSSFGCKLLMLCKVFQGFQGLRMHTDIQAFKIDN